MKLMSKAYWPGAIIFVLLGALFLTTSSDIKSVPQSFHEVLSDSHNVQILARNGEPLNITYQNRWNIHDIAHLYDIPGFLKKAFIISEDKRFYQHSGADWYARFSALVSNIRNMRIVRGGSTITEQVVRMINPRPRTIWSRWLEGFEATELEQSFKKDAILEFYLNQVPYASNRRGIIQAARYYFDRDLGTLSHKEMLALVILVRAPSHMDLWKNPERIEASMARLSNLLVIHGLFGDDEKKIALQQTFNLKSPTLSINAPEFVSYVRRHELSPLAGWPIVKTTLDASLQNRVQTLLDIRLGYLESQQVHNGAVLVVDHQSGEILAWVVAGKDGAFRPGRLFDAVRTPRQPGSALKPFLYARALEKGWSAATVIDDSPLTESVGSGLHTYHNYSRSFYGPVTLRQAIGNSLNIPALKTLQFIGAEDYLNFLSSLGFESLKHHPDFYGDGIALGNGEVTLYEMVQAYATLANQGIFQPLKVFPYGLTNAHVNKSVQHVISPEVASLMGNILSDPDARTLEFGEDNVLNIPVQTAVKTGTSSDYRDSWALGYNYRYTVGVWMGNLDQLPSDGITGSTGPALLMRSIFYELTKHQDTKPIPIHTKLVRYDLCLDTKQVKQDDIACETYTEWFVPGTVPTSEQHFTHTTVPIRLRHPANGLNIAYDPRVPKASQVFEFFIQGIKPEDTVVWEIDGHQARSKGGTYDWPLQRGKHLVNAMVWRGKRQIAEIERTGFLVK